MPKTKPKLLITTGIFPPEIGGPAVYVQQLASALTEHWQVTVVTYSPRWRVSDDRKLSYRLVRVWRRWPAPWRRLLYFIHGFSWAARADRILVLNVMDGGLPVWLAAKLWRKPYLVRISGDRVWEAATRRGHTDLQIDVWQNMPKGWRYSWRWRLQGRICRQAQTVIAHSRYLAKLAEGWGVSAEKVKLVYSGSDFIPAALSREQARVQIGIAGNIILTGGRLVPWKGCRMLVKLMPQLLALNQFFRLVIVGDGPERPALAQMARNLGLEKKVYLVGEQSRAQLAVYLAAANLFVYNTGYEGLSHQLLEAMAAGVPIVTTTAGGNPELIRQGENGFMVKFNDEFNLLEAIKTLWQNSALREQFAAAGRETASQFSLEKMVAQTERLISHG